MRPFQHEVLKNPHCSRVFSLVRVPRTWNIVQFAQLLLVEPAREPKSSISISHKLHLIIRLKLPDAAPRVKKLNGKLMIRSKSSLKS